MYVVNAYYLISLGKAIFVKHVLFPVHTEYSAFI